MDCPDALPAEKAISDKLRKARVALVKERLFMVDLS